jgi:hypothetical protein
MTAARDARPPQLVNGFCVFEENAMRRPGHFGEPSHRRSSTI